MPRPTHVIVVKLTLIHKTLFASKRVFFISFYFSIMKLLTQSLLSKFREVGDQRNVEDSQIICKFFYPLNQWTWYCISYDEESETFFWLVNGHELELGYFSLSELQAFRGSFWIGIERDLYFQEGQTLSDIQKLCYA